MVVQKGIYKVRIALITDITGQDGSYLAEFLLLFFIGLNNYFRPSEVDPLLGDASKVKRMLSWEPTIKFDDLVKIMVEYDHAQGG